MTKTLLLAVISLTFALTSCKKDRDHDASGIFKSADQNFQHGKAWTWIRLSKSGNPERVGITIDSLAMRSLDPGEGHNNGHSHVNSISVNFPSQAGATPFRHAMLDWNPLGHEPAGLYDKPHFDFHFYMIPESERMAIPAYEADSLRFKDYPAPSYMPATYVPIAGGVPQMGAHWIDVTTPEINGAPFTQTFLLGSYSGKVLFYEPMITKAFLDTTTSFQRSFGVPAKFQQSAWFPTSMRVEKIKGSISVILEGFVYRTKS